MIFLYCCNVTALLLFLRCFVIVCVYTKNQSGVFRKVPFKHLVTRKTVKAPGLIPGAFCMPWGFCRRSTHRICKTPAYPAGVLKERRRGRDSNPRINSPKINLTFFRRLHSTTLPPLRLGIHDAQWSSFWLVSSVSLLYHHM